MHRRHRLPPRSEPCGRQLPGCCGREDRQLRLLRVPGAAGAAVEFVLSGATFYINSRHLLTKLP
jgi:hypothetical protein